MIAFNALKRQVGPWSQSTFGNSVLGSIRLDFFAPLTGVGEELGEFLDADLQSQRIDAVGDVLIYLADFCRRLNFDLEDGQVLDESVTFDVVFRYYTRMQHICLKRIQGIRGYDSDRKFNKDIVKNTQLFFEAFVALSTSFGIDTGDAMQITWDKVRTRGQESAV